MVHALPSLQASVPVPPHLPPKQTSPVVQTSPSLHEAVLFTELHAPVAPSQLSVVHTLLSLQFFGVPGLQLPAEHTSLSVQAFPSSHAAVLLMKPHPVTAWHTAVVHGLLSSAQVTGRPTHTEFAQVSPVVQAEKSSHGAPSFEPLQVTCASTSNDDSTTTATSSERATMNSPGRSLVCHANTWGGSDLSSVSGRASQRSHGNTCR